MPTREGGNRMLSTRVRGPEAIFSFALKLISTISTPKGQTEHTFSGNLNMPLFELELIISATSNREGQHRLLVSRPRWETSECPLSESRNNGLFESTICVYLLACTCKAWHRVNSRLHLFNVLPCLNSSCMRRDLGVGYSLEVVPHTKTG